MASKFIHLHTHSHYSLLDGMSKVQDIVKIAKESKMPAVALTDHGNMYGAIEFYKTCKDAGIKPIIGVEAYMTAGSRKDKNTEQGAKRYYHLILLAKNLQGYKNLIRLVTIANLEGYYYKPRMDKEILREFHEGIICLSGCMGGELSQTILAGLPAQAGNTEKADAIVAEYQDIFGKENYFIEVQSHPHIENDKKLRDALVTLGKKHSIPVVATQDSHYPCHDDHEAHRTLLAINTGEGGKDTGKFEFSDDDFSLINEKKALEYFADIPESVANTSLVADMCEDYDLGLGHWVFPDLGLPAGVTADDKLRELAEEGFARREMKETDEARTRLEYELGIIKMKGYSPYFLVVGDLLRFAKENNILTTIRGSVAGSLTTYLLGITNVNPFEYNLPFERFLNPERPSPPDIDMDYADNRRDEVIEYAKQKYGADKVAQIGTFGTMMARGAVRDVARSLGYPYGIGDRISKLVPMGSQGMPMTLDHAMKIVPELTEIYKSEPDTKRIIDLAKKLEGCVRHISVHAAGVVIAPTSLYDFVPVQLDPKGGKIITQYDMYSVEDAGLLKFDFLGIRNLAILGETIRLVEMTKTVRVDIEKIPLDDKKTFSLLARGETTGLFQLNGAGMTRFLKELEPSTIHDINAMVALYRPGPMQFIPDYIARKHNPKLIKYFDPALEAILHRTYGILVYQDDLLTIAHDLAGYTWGEVDKFRKAVGKKIPEEMAAQKQKFIKGTMAHSKWSEKKAAQIWTWIEPFAAYGFNKAHAASYGRVAYQTAYMKAHYPVEYMCAILTSESGDVEKISEIIQESQKMEIKVLPPDVNESFGGFTVVESASADDKNGLPAQTGVIRFGLYTIKNLGTDISDAIIEERRAKGRYADMADFLKRITHKNLTKKSLEALIKSGSMDFAGERGQLLANMETLLAYNKEGLENANQTSLFGEMPNVSALTLEPATAATNQEKLSWEKELLGLYVSGHPLDRLREKIEKNGMTIKKAREELGNNMPVMFAGIIEEVRVIVTKKNEQMAFIKISDMTGVIEAVVFSRTYQDARETIVADTCIAVKGRMSERNGDQSIVIEVIKKI